MRIVGTQVLHEVLVANISDRFILGLDFLMAHSCTVDAGSGSLQFEQRKLPFISLYPANKPVAIE